MTVSATQSVIIVSFFGILIFFMRITNSMLVSIEHDLRARIVNFSLVAVSSDGIFSS